MQGRAELLVKGAFEGMMISKLRASYNHQVHVDYLDQRHRWLHTCICYGIQLYEIKAENFHWKKKLYQAQLPLHYSKDRHTCSYMYLLLKKLWIRFR